MAIHKRMNADQVSIESFNIVQDSYAGEWDLKWVVVQIFFTDLHANEGNWSAFEGPD